MRLSLAHVTPPWGGVLCHEQAHIMTDECGAPEFFGGGLKLIGLPGEGCKLTRGDGRDGDRALFRPCPASGQCHRRSSITQATEGRHHLPGRGDRGTWPDSPMRTAWPCIWTARVSAMRWRA